MNGFEAKRSPNFIMSIFFTFFAIVFLFAEFYIGLTLMTVSLLLWGTSIYRHYFGKTEVTFKNGVLTVLKRGKEKRYNIKDYVQIKYHSDSEGQDWITGTKLVDGKYKREKLLLDAYDIRLKDIYKVLEEYRTNGVITDHTEQEQLRKELMIKYNETLTAFFIVGSVLMNYGLMFIYGFIDILFISGSISFVALVIYYFMRKKIVTNKAIERTFMIVGMLLLSLTMINFFTV